MDAIEHHLPAIIAIVAVVVVPIAAVVCWRFIARRNARLFRDAMLRGNMLHRDWLERSKGGDA